LDGAGFFALGLGGLALRVGIGGLETEARFGTGLPAGPLDGAGFFALGFGGLALRVGIGGLETEARFGTALPAGPLDGAGFFALGLGGLLVSSFALARTGRPVRLSPGMATPLDAGETFFCDPAPFLLVIDFAIDYPPD
jgi:uncharacterized RDD family membrane protein YckC